MALQKMRAPVLLKGGLAQDTDDVALGLGEGFVLQENLKYDRGGVLKKRHGYSALTDSTFRGLASVDLTKVRSLHSHRGALVAALDDDPTTLTSYTDAGWSEHGWAAPCALRRQSAIRLGEGSVDNVQGNVTGAWTVISYVVSEFLFYKQLDTETGAVVQDERLLVGGDCKGHRAITLSGGDVLVVYYFDDGATTELRCFRLKPNTGSPFVVSPDLVLDTVAITGFDAVADPTDPDVFYVAWCPRFDIKVQKLTVGALPFDAPVSVAGPLTHAEPNTTGALCCDIYGNGDLWVAFSRFSAGTCDVRLGRWTTSPFAAAGFSTVYTDATAAAGTPRVVVGLDGWVGWEPVGTGGGGFQQMDGTGATTGSRRYLWHCKIESRYFRHRSHDWLLVRDVYADHYALVRPDQGQDSPSTWAYHGAVCLDIAAGVGLFPLADVSSVLDLGSNTFRWACGVRNGVVNPNTALTKGARGADLVDLYFDHNQAPCLSATEAAECLVMGGGCTPHFDGQAPVESGFLRAPVILSHTVTGGGGSIEGAGAAPGDYNVYLYAAHYEWQDARGNWHRSEASTPYVVEVSLADTNATVQLTLATLGLTRRGDTLLFGGRNARVALFRTEKNAPSGPWYRLDDPTLSEVKNERGSEYRTYSDDAADSAIIALGFGRLYTEGGALDDQLPPPSLAVATWQQRAWLISGDDPRQIHYSKQILPGEAPRWNRSQLFVEIEEEATGLAVNGATLLIFSRSRIYALSGEGPADTGALANWRGPYAVSEAVGCVDGRSIVDFPGGTVFQSELGFHLLTTPQAPPVFIGSSVLQVVRDYPICRGAAHDEAGGRLLWTMARSQGQSLTLVFDYLRAAWQVWSPGGESSSRYPGALCVHQGAHHYAAGLGLMKQSTSLQDDDQYFSWRLILPWARLQGVAGFQRLWHVLVALKRSSGVNVLVRLRHDESTAIAQETAHTLADLDTETGGRLVIDTHVAQQKCRSVQVELAEELVTGETETGGLEIYGVDLELGQKKGRFKAAQENRK